MTIVHSLKILDFNRTPAFYMHGHGKGPSINYVSMAEGGGGNQMLKDAHVREGVYLKY